VFDEIIALSGGDPQVGRELCGYSPLIAAEQCAAWAQAQTGRFDACWPRAARAIRLAREQGIKENLGWALGTLANSAYLAQGTSRVPVPDLIRAALEAVDIAEAVGSRYSQIIASSHLATAYLVSGDYAASVAGFTACLANARSFGTALETEAQNLAMLADACAARGDHEAAVRYAREGIAVADAGGAWFQSAQTRAALIDALVGADGPEPEVADLLDEARELVRKSGGNGLLPRLRESEARLVGRRDRAALAVGLRAAEAMYRAMGTPDPADRLVRELQA
jgi:tetratricopeptide (TPR) repeat protein